MLKASSIAAMALLLTVACAPGESGDASPTPTTTASSIHFVDEAAARGVTLKAIAGDLEKHHILETLGCGAAIADVDNDGDEDLYLTTAQTSVDWVAGERPLKNALYLNDGSGQFTEAAAEAGVDLAAWSLGAYFADVDNDGDQDLFVTTWGRNKLYLNRGDGSFEDASEASGLSERDAWSTSAAFADLDSDGDLDLYVANYAFYSLVDPPLGGQTMTWRGVRVFMGPVGLDPEPDRLYRNDGNGRFTDITEQSGIDSVTTPHYGLGVVMADVDQDRDLDIFVANDTMANFLWVNDGTMQFTETALGAGVATDQNAREQAGMGVDAADYDGDGWIDLVVTNFSHDFNTLHRNRGDLTFADATYEANFKDSYKHLVWGTKFFDIDLDGWQDVFMANGHIYSVLETYGQANTTYRQQNSLYRNTADGSFESIPSASGPGMLIEESSRGMAVGDLDGDGDLDFVVTNIDAAPSLLINQSTTGAAVRLQLQGTESNRDAIGARVEATVGERTLVREVNPFGSFLSQSSPELFLGLGDAPELDSLVVYWPSGTVDRIEQSLTAGRYTLEEGSGEARTR